MNHYVEVEVYGLPANDQKALRGLFLIAFRRRPGLPLRRLDIRPMHHDEANQAVKFGDLLERAIIASIRWTITARALLSDAARARAAGTRTLAGLDEATLRAVPALFGAGLLLLFLLFAGGISREARLAAAALAAVSPA